MMDKRVTMKKFPIFFIVILTLCMVLSTPAEAAKKKSVTITTKIGSSTLIYVGNSKAIGAKGKVSCTLTYKSSNTKVVKVTSKGTVKAVAAGTAKITITAKPKSKAYKTTTKKITIRVLKKVKKYKIIYHYSQDNTAKQVTKTVTVGSYPALLSASSLNFKSSSKLFVGWNAYWKRTKKWKLYSANLTSSSWKASKSGNLYTFTVGSKIKEKFIEGDELHLYGQWIDAENVDITTPCFYVGSGGTLGTDRIDSAESIQKALDLAKTANRHITVKIPAGKYYTASSLRVYSNTTLSLADNTKMIRLSGASGPRVWVGQDSSLGGIYKQAQNVTIQGGTWINNPLSGESKNSVMRFVHCKNVTLKDCNIENFSGKHAVVFAGVYNGTISNVTFEDQIIGTYLSEMIANKPSSALNAEAIHIDTTSKEGEPDAYPIDNTPCSKITVQNCVFDNVLSGVGGHVEENDTVGDTLKVINNEFHDIKYVCIDIFNKTNVTVSGNKVYLYQQYIREYNAVYLIKEAEILYSITDDDKTTMREQYQTVLNNLKNYSFTHAGNNIKRYDYFLYDLNGDGIRELVVGAVFLSKDGTKEFHDCKVFTCRKSISGYTLKNIYGVVVGEQIYLPAEGKGIYNRITDDSTQTNIIYRMTLLSNTISQKKEAEWLDESEEEISFEENNTSVVWISSVNRAAISSIKE